jgi:hypothetical protein
MKQENPVYVKFDLQDALYSKKSLISSEITLLKISKSIGKYNLYRQAELQNKLKILKKVQEVKADFDLLKENFPKLKIQKNKEVINEIVKIKETKKENLSSDLEKQLEEIQARLRQFN